MSSSIDERIVQMTFNNQAFEKGIAKTLDSLATLKESLNFSNIANIGSNLSFNTLTSALDKVNDSFTVMGQVAMNVISKISGYINNLVNDVTGLVKGLTVDQLSEGWAKYGDKTTSVATLVSQGYDMETVNEQLDKLNWYTDETSYNFTNMVANIAKFTATGQGLEDSVTAMMGIANWAASAGQNASTASSAMYQISQAMGAGVMRKEDYKSIQNASMDTIEFRKEAIKAAIALGKLKDNGDGTYTSIVEGASGATWKIEQFADNLTQELWFDKEVMMSVFSTYGGVIDQLYEVSDEYDTTSQAIDALGDQLDAQQLKWFKSAQEARTFADVIDSVKDAVSTGWMNTFEIIFGQYNEAVKLWTDMANSLWEVFASGGEARNEILSTWKETGGRDRFIHNLYNSAKNLWEIVTDLKDAWHEVFPDTMGDIMVKVLDSLSKINLTIITLKTILNYNDFFKVLTKLFEVIKVISSGISFVFSYTIKPLVKVAKTLFVNLLRAMSSFADMVTDIAQIFSFATKGPIAQFGRGLANVLNTIVEIVSTSGMLTSIFSTITSGASYAANFIKHMQSAKAFEPLVSNILLLVKNLINSLKILSKTIVDTISPIISTLAPYIVPLINVIVSRVTSLISIFGKTVTMINDITKAVTGSSSIGEFIAKSIEYIIKKAKGLFQTWNAFKSTILTPMVNIVKSVIITIGKYIGRVFQSIDKNINIFYMFRDALKVIGGALTNLFNNFKLSDSTFERFGIICDRIAIALGIMYDWALKAIGWIIEHLTILGPVIDFVVDVFFELTEVIGNIYKWAVEKQVFTKIADGVNAFYGIVSNTLTAIIDWFREFFGLAKEDETAEDGMLNYFDKVSESLTPIKDHLLAAKDALKEWLGLAENENITVIDVIAASIDKLKELLQPLTNRLIAAKDAVIEFLKAFAFGKENEETGEQEDIGFFSLLVECFGKLLSYIPGALATLGGYIKKLWDEVGGLRGVWEIVKDIINSGTFVSLGAFIQSMANKNNAQAEGRTGLFGNIAVGLNAIKEACGGFKESLGNVSAAIKEFADNGVKENPSTTILKLAISILILSFAMDKIAALPMNKVIQSFSAVVGLLISLISSMKFIVGNDITGSAGRALSKLSSTMIKLSIAVLILAYAMNVIKDLSVEQVVQGCIAVAAGMIVLVKAVTALTASNFDKSIKYGAKAILTMAIALVVLAFAVSKLGKMDWGDMFQGLIGVVILLAALQAYLDKAFMGNSDVKSARGLLVLAIAVRILASSVKTLGEIDTDTLIVGMLAVVALIVAIAGATAIMDGTKVKGLSLVILVIAIAVKILVGAIKGLMEVDPANMIGAFASVIILLYAMVVAISILNGMQAGTGSIIDICTGVTLLASGLSTLSEAMVEMSKVKAKSLAKGLLFLGAALILMIGGVAAMFAVVTHFSGAALPALALAAAMLILGAALLLIGAGVTTIAGGLLALGSAFAVAGAEIAVGLNVLIAGIIAAIPTLVIAVVNGIIDILDSLGNAAVKIIEIVVKLGRAICAALIILIPDLMNVIIMAILELCIVLYKYGPILIATIVLIVIQLIAVLLQLIPPLINLLVNAVAIIIYSIADAIGHGGPVLFQAVKNILYSIGQFILGIVNDLFGWIPGIGDYLDECIDSLEELKDYKLMDYEVNEDLQKQIENSMASFDTAAAGIMDTDAMFATGNNSGIATIKGLIDGMSSQYKDVEETGEEASGSFFEGFQLDTVTGEKKSDSFLKGFNMNDFLGTGKDGSNNLIKGLNTESFNLEGVDLGSDVISGFNTNDYLGTGEFATEGLLEGVNTGTYDGLNAYDSGKSLGFDVLDGYTDTLDINSPSRIMKQMGNYTTQGLINGLQEYSDKVYDNGELLGDNTLEGVKTALGGIKDVTLDDDITPTIRPVLDADSLNAARNQILSTMNSTELSQLSMGNMNAINSIDINSKWDNADIVSAISDLREQMANIGDAIFGMNVVMDSGSLVGSIVEQMDSALGQRTIMKGRGI